MPNTDPWLDDQFAPIDNRTGPEHYAHLATKAAEDAIEEGEGGLAAFLEQAENKATETYRQTAQKVEPTPTPTPVPVVETADQPRVIELEDGGKVSIEKNAKGWKAILDTGTGAGPETFHARTKDELLDLVLVGKLNATRKIRELNKERKLGALAPKAVEPEATPMLPEQTQVRQMTADEANAWKLQLESDPSLAMKTWFQSQTGWSLEEMTEILKQSRVASLSLQAEEEANAFVALHPEYSRLPEDYETILIFLTRKYAKKFPRFYPQEETVDAMMDYLVNNGIFKRNVLSAAFTELAEAGLVTVNQTEPEVVEAVTKVVAPTPAAVVTPAPAPQAVVAPTPTTEQVAPNPRIVSRERRPRASLGIHASDTTAPVAPEDTTRVPSAEELDRMTDDEINQLFTGIRQHAAQSARRTQ